VIEKTQKNIAVLLFFVFSFAYRLLLLNVNIYPPGADIGQHESFINSLMHNTDFFSNYYHMGGGLAATNPNYHIFIILIKAFTNLPDYVCHSIVIAFFSALMVLSTFLILKRIWNETAALIGSFLVILCAGDIEMLSWGGYSNIVALFLISIIANLYLQETNFAKRNYFIVASLLLASLFLTHTFSALNFSAIVLLASILALMSKKIAQLKEKITFWIPSLALGLLIISPYMAKYIFVHFGSEGSVTGAVLETKLALLETKAIPVENILLLILPIMFFFIISKLYKKQYFTLPAVLFASWIAVPTIMTQSHIAGIYLDYSRFLYFLNFPLIICLALFIERTRAIILKTIKLASQTAFKATKNNIRTTIQKRCSAKILRFLNFFLIFSLISTAIFFTPLLIKPNQGVEFASYYQVMTSDGYEAIEWIKANTLNNSVFVANAEYGWWIAGFAQRPTLSAVPPQHLMLSHELEAAAIARNLLRSDYFIDNGIIHINHNKQLNNANNFEITTKITNSSIVYPFFFFKDEDINILYRYNNTSNYTSFSDVPINSTHINYDSKSAKIEIIRENDAYIFTTSITSYKGIRFAKISISLESKIEGLNFDWLHFPFLSRGRVIQQEGNIVFVDLSAKILSQIIFPNEQNINNNITLIENPDTFELVNNLGGTIKREMEFYTGTTPINAIEKDDEINRLISINYNTYFDIISDETITFFDALDAIKVWNISYVVATSSDHVPRFNNNQYFSCIFRNNDVSIFKVNRAFIK